METLSIIQWIGESDIKLLCVAFLLLEMSIALYSSPPMPVLDPCLRWAFGMELISGFKLHHLRILPPTYFFSICGTCLFQLLKAIAGFPGVGKIRPFSFVIIVAAIALMRFCKN
jgi:hypothetical protein